MTSCEDWLDELDRLEKEEDHLSYVELDRYENKVLLHASELIDMSMKWRAAVEDERWVNKRDRVLTKY